MNTENHPTNPLAPERVALTAAAIAGLTSSLSVAPSPEILKRVAATTVTLADLAYITLTQTKA